jgi:ComF family protein
LHGKIGIRKKNQSILSRPQLNKRINFRQYSLLALAAGLLPAQACALCGAPSRHGAWCPACDAALPQLPAARCPVCALPTPDGSACGRCLKKRPQFDRTAAAFAYAFPVNKLVQALKFNEQLHLANPLADRLASCVDVRPDCIVPMPLHPARLMQRGHNQSLEIARRIASRLDVPLAARSCLRVRDTPPQSSLKWKERGKNMRRAFQCTESFSGKHVAMIDDVMTSGASLNELALALRRAGATEVSAWVVARTLPNADS